MIRHVQDQLFSAHNRILTRLDEAIGTFPKRRRGECRRLLEVARKGCTQLEMQIAEIGDSLNDLLRIAKARQSDPQAHCEEPSPLKQNALLSQPSG